MTEDSGRDRVGRRGKGGLKHKNNPSVLRLGDSDRNTEHRKTRFGRGGKPLVKPAPERPGGHETGPGGVC